MNTCNHEHGEITRRGMPLTRGRNRGYRCGKCGDTVTSLPMAVLARRDARRAILHYEAALAALAEVRGGPIGITSYALEAEEQIRRGLAFCEKLLTADQSVDER